MSDELFRSLGRIEGKLDSLGEDVTEIKTKLADHDKRIGTIENFRIQALTIAGLAGTAASFVWDTIRHKFGA